MNTNLSRPHSAYSAYSAKTDDLFYETDSKSEYSNDFQYEQEQEQDEEKASFSDYLFDDADSKSAGGRSGDSCSRYEREDDIAMKNYDDGFYGNRSDNNTNASGRPSSRNTRTGSISVNDDSKFGDFDVDALPRLGLALDDRLTVDASTSISTDHGPKYPIFTELPTPAMIRSIPETTSATSLGVPRHSRSSLQSTSNTPMQMPNTNSISDWLNFRKGVGISSPSSLTSMNLRDRDSAASINGLKDALDNLENQMGSYRQVGDQERSALHAYNKVGLMPHDDAFPITPISKTRNRNTSKSDSDHIVDNISMKNMDLLASPLRRSGTAVMQLTEKHKSYVEQREEWSKERKEKESADSTTSTNNTALLAALAAGGAAADFMLANLSSV
tara:strand:+ start:213 stop:1373 length:1161 start_codon:yes stop_codon:yes gene_type:complete